MRLWRRRQGGRSRHRRSRGARRQDRSLIVAEGSGSRSRSPAASIRRSRRRAQADIVVLAIGEVAEHVGRSAVAHRDRRPRAAAAARRGGRGGRQADRRRPQARPRAGARGRGRERAGDPRHLVPRAPRPAMRSPTSCSAPTALPAGFPRASRARRARSLIITRTRRPAGPTRRASWSPTRRISAASRTARSTRSATASPTGRSNMAGSR